MSDTRTNPRGDSTDNRTVTLPVVPLTSTVVLPGAVATLALDSDDARRAAAQRPPGRRPRPPRPPGRGPLREGGHRRPRREHGRAARRHRRRDPAHGAARRHRRRRRRRRAVGQCRARRRPGPDSGRSARSPSELRVVLEQIAEQRRSRRLPEILRTVHEPGRAGRRRDVVGRQRDRGQARRARGDRRRRAAAARARRGHVRRWPS